MYYFRTFHRCLAAVESRPNRDLRIDLVRGIALLILFSDHIRGNIVARYTPMAVGLSDMSEVFVLLSGYSCGISYGRRLDKNGFWSCVNRAWTRAGQIYAVKLLVTAMALVILVFVANWVTPSFFGIPWSMQLVQQHPLETLIEFELFRLELFQFFVLALYIPFLIVLPVGVVGISKSPLAVFVASALVYVGAQLFAETITLPEPWRGAMFFNPFAWQFLFFSACNFAMMNEKSGARLRPPLVLAILAMLVVSVAVVAHWQCGIPRNSLTDKRNLGCVRVVHVVAVIIAGWWLVPDSSVLSRVTFIRPIIVCGRYPLVAYCTGGILAILAETAMRIFSTDWPMHLFLNLLGWGGCLAATNSCWCLTGVQEKNIRRQTPP